MRFAESCLTVTIFSVMASSALAAEGAATSAVPAPAVSVDATGMTLPDWHEPDAYSVDLVIQGQGKTFTMERAVDHGRRRSRIAMDEGQEMVLIEVPDDQGTTYTLMPAQKMALKQTADALAGIAPRRTTAAPDTAANNEQVVGAKVELLGNEDVDGKSAHKYRVTFQDGAGFAWFDAQTNQPLRMEADVSGNKSTLEWKNWRIGPQKAELFEVPKDYTVQDVGQMMKMVQGMSGSALGGLAAGAAGAGGMPGGVAIPGGIPGMPGGIPGMPGGFGGMSAGGMGERMGSHFGAQFGESLGAGFGGPLGGMAGHYLGGKVGGFLGKKIVGAF